MPMDPLPSARESAILIAMRQINAPARANAISRKTGQPTLHNGSIYNYMNRLIDKGYVKRFDTKYYLTETGKSHPIDETYCKHGPIFCYSEMPTPTEMAQIAASAKAFLDWGNRHFEPPQTVLAGRLLRYLQMEGYGVVKLEHVDKPLPGV